MEKLWNKKSGWSVQSDTLLLADVFESFRNKCIETHEIDPADFLSAPGLAWQACLKKTEVDLEFSTGTDMLLIAEKGIRGGICHVIHWHATANNKYNKEYNKDNEFKYKQSIWMSNISKITCRWFLMEKKLI